MHQPSAPQLTPIAFLQTFAVQSLRAAKRLGCAQCEDELDHVEHIGLTAGACFEEACRRQQGLDGPIDLDQYADLILSIKNQIGGNFSRTSSDPGAVRVVNSRCPFGDMVKQAPELCRMTASVFGGIAARNFGYAKVELRRRIATGDDGCEVCIYTDRDSARGQPGDEYHNDNGRVVSQAAATQLRDRVEEKIHHVWCMSAHGTDAQDKGGPKIIAESAAMRQALEAVEIVAPTTATVLITGETGVGKEIVARAVHALSPRSARNLVAVNAGAIAENLVESVLFGHEKGAFTGAYHVHHGLFERAEHGTLFLDEIDCLPVSAQAKLLRVLQEGEFERVGGRQTLRADVRIIAATNCDIERLVEQGDFRRDLYYRLNVVPICIPPLRERRDDLNALVHHLLRRIAEQHGQSRKVLGERAWQQVSRYHWPGNIRELENVLERAFLFARGPVIETLPLLKDKLPDASPQALTAPAPESAGQHSSLRTLTKQAALDTEKELIRAALTRMHGNVTAVARHIGISPRAVHQKLRKHGIDPRQFRPTQAGDSAVQG
ncbi:sigma 54-interacting transcriptional regulator [Thiohalocapsa halophila]